MTFRGILPWLRNDPLADCMIEGCGFRIGARCLRSNDEVYAKAYLHSLATGHQVMCSMRLRMVVGAIEKEAKAQGYSVAERLEK